jgi:hypothetical protein
VNVIQDTGLGILIALLAFVFIKAIIAAYFAAKEEYVERLVHKQKETNDE